MRVLKRESEDSKEMQYDSRKSDKMIKVRKMDKK